MKQIESKLKHLQNALNKVYKLQSLYYSDSWNEKREEAAGNAREDVYMTAEELAQDTGLGAVYLKTNRGMTELFSLETFQFE